jgi:putative addiction module component (TIGR02574 family)
MAAEECHMPDYDSVLSDARNLPVHDQLRLIDALWNAVPADVDLPLHEDWAPELERRVSAIRSGTAQTTAWETVLAEALARIK